MRPIAGFPDLGCMVGSFLERDGRIRLAISFGKNLWRGRPTELPQFRLHTLREQVSREVWR